MKAQLYNPNQDPVSQMRNFLKRSRKAFSNDVKLACNHLEALRPGNWWHVFMTSDTNNQVLKRAKRLNIDAAAQDLSSYSSLITSPMSQSPWTIKLDNPDAKLQKGIDSYQGYLDTKEQLLRCATRGTLVGRGWLNFHLEEGEPRLEFVSNQSSVWADPDSRKADNSDAMETAVVNWVPASKYPGVMRLQEIGGDVDDWSVYGEEEDSQGSITDAYYYRKEDDGSVWCYHIVGAELQESTKLPFSMIPILCFSAWNAYDSTKANQFVGICQKTFDLVLLRNLCLSQLADRQNRSVKAKVAMSDKSIKGLEGAVKAALNAETPLLMYREGAAAPVMLNETQNYTDIESVLTMTRNQMDAVCGVTLVAETPESRTASEVLIREEHRESSLESCYSHFQMLCYSLSKLVLQSLVGEVVPFSLTNGPSHISETYRLRKDLAALKEFYANDDKMLQALGFAVAQTTGNTNLISLCRANLSAEVKIPDDTNILDMIREGSEAAQVAEELANTNQELEQQAQEAAAQAQSLQTLLENNEKQYKLDIAKMQLDAQQKEIKNQQEMAKLQIELEKAKAEIAKLNAETVSQQIDNEAKAQELIQPQEEVVVVGGI